MSAGFDRHFANSGCQILNTGFEFDFESFPPSFEFMLKKTGDSPEIAQRIEMIFSRKLKTGLSGKRGEPNDSLPLGRKQILLVSRSERLNSNIFIINPFRFKNEPFRLDAE